MAKVVSAKRVMIAISRFPLKADVAGVTSRGSSPRQRQVSNFACASVPFWAKWLAYVIWTAPTPSPALPNQTFPTSEKSGGLNR